jgi:hypothetical protein
VQHTQRYYKEKAKANAWQGLYHSDLISTALFEKDISLGQVLVSLCCSCISQPQNPSIFNSVHQHCCATPLSWLTTKQSAF